VRAGFSFGAFFLTAAGVVASSDSSLPLAASIVPVIGGLVLAVLANAWRPREGGE
jgi:hypothetical protein